jgi:hypothetical protein
MKRIIARLFGLYTDKQATSFGNYLLSEKRESNVSDACRRAVTHADECNWKHEQKSKR